MTSCSSSPQAFTDNGKPGQIKAVVFYDANANGILDQGETGLVDRVSISQDISCPPSNVKNITNEDTNNNGEAVFKDLKPGRYCVAYMGSKGVTTKLSAEVFLSSEQEVQVNFGLLEK